MAVIRNERMMEILTSTSVEEGTRRQFLSELYNVQEREDDYDEDEDEFDEHEVAQSSSVPAWHERGSPLTEERARLLLTELRDVVISQGYFYSKVLRPWEHDPNIYERLDPNAVWWGWEFETGYNSPVDRSVVVGHVWDTWDGVTFDCEGNGYSSEITFVPQEMSKFLDGTADACGFVRYLESQGDRIDPEGGPFVGTHINFSFPEFRSNTGVVSEIVSTLNQSMLWMEDSAEFRTRYFGRDPFYGMFYTHDTWIEGKLFRTTYDHSRFCEYMRVAKAFVRITRAILDCDRANLICTNITDVIKNDDAPVILRETAKQFHISHLPGRNNMPAVSLDGEWVGRMSVEQARSIVSEGFLPEVFTYPSKES